MLTMAERRLRSRPGNLAPGTEVERGGYVVVGSPDTVRQRLEDYAQRVGFGMLVANFRGQCALRADPQKHDAVRPGGHADAQTCE